MRLIAASTGSFPRIGDGSQEQQLRKALASLDRQEIDLSGLKAVEEEVTREAIALQAVAGVDLLTDGHIRWHDAVSHVMGKLQGVQVGPLSRFFDTNTYYRQPIVQEKIVWQRPLVLDEFLFAQRNAPKPVKPVLTGPCTLARLSVNQAYGNTDELMEAIGIVIAEEVKALAEAGAAVIQIDEPSLLQNPQDIARLRPLLEAANRCKGTSELALYTYFGDAAPVCDELQQLPVDILGLDFTYSTNLVEILTGSGIGKKLGLGLVDGRNTRMETEADIFPVLEALSALPGVDDCYLNPSCGLEYLPKERAVAKLKNMVGLRDKFIGGKHA
ncbi:MAG: methylcobamide--CoM methyltransferase [Dehalococcoidia bacterium]|nr:methylcobamide--CoM methyltransferase [Dehalococcoidia bacterium]